MTAPVQPTLVLLGDSTLDNVLWVPSPSSCIAFQLRAMGFNVVNYAADGFTTTDVLHGGNPLLSRSVRERVGDALPGWSADGNDCSRELFEPLKHVEVLVRKSAESDSMGITAVLSVGGNDIRHILSDMKGVESAVKRLHSNYAAILDHLLRLRPMASTVVCMQYRPCVSEGIERSALHLPPTLIPIQLKTSPSSSFESLRDRPKILRGVCCHGHATRTRQRCCETQQANAQGVCPYCCGCLHAWFGSHRLAQHLRREEQ